MVGVIIFNTDASACVVALSHLACRHHPYLDLLGKSVGASSSLAGIQRLQPYISTLNRCQMDQRG